MKKWTFLTFILCYQLVSFYCEQPENIWKSAVLSVSVTTTQFNSAVVKSSCRQHVNKWTGLCAHTTLFT